MLISEILFWLSFALLFYCYIGYGVIVLIINQITSIFLKKTNVKSDTLLPVTLIISAYNEEEILSEKIANTLAIDYDHKMFSVIIITDGSTDRSVELMKHYPDFIHLHSEQRLGKLAAIKRAMTYVKTPVVVFSDANTMLNPACMKRIVRHYDFEEVGGVAGEKKILSTINSAVGQAEGMYWKYESFMKRQDAKLNSVVGAAGELFSIRTELFEPPDDNVILDDFVISMRVCMRGKRIVYEPGAYATEKPSASLEEETKRKIRISAGAYQSIGILKPLLNIFSHPVLSFQYISRRVLRWVVCPLMILILLVTNVLLLSLSGNDVYLGTFIVQCLIYIAAASGWLLMKKNRPAGIFAIPFYFLFMNYCLIRGFLRFVRRGQSVTWEKSKRM